MSPVRTAKRLSAFPIWATKKDASLSASAYQVGETVYLNVHSLALSFGLILVGTGSDKIFILGDFGSICRSITYMYVFPPLACPARNDHRKHPSSYQLALNKTTHFQISVSKTLLLLDKAQYSLCWHFLVPHPFVLASSFRRRSLFISFRQCLFSFLPPPEIGGGGALQFKSIGILTRQQAEF